MPIEINDLESIRFGIVAARLIADDVRLETIDEVAGAALVDMITTRVDVGNYLRVHALEGAGYRLMDTLIYYECALDRWQDNTAEEAVMAPRLATAEDRPIISVIAQAAFSNYVGHYHADPRLNDQAADAAYVEWAETSASASSEDSPVLILCPLGRAGGFLTLRRNTPEEYEIVLNGVHPDFERKGIYTSLVRHALNVARSAGAKRMIVSTQINNYRVQRVWSRLGFAPYKSLYTFHKWYNIGA